MQRQKESLSICLWLLQQFNKAHPDTQKLGISPQNKGKKAKKQGPTGIRTQGAGFKVPSDNRYTIGPAILS